MKEKNMNLKPKLVQWIKKKLLTCKSNKYFYLEASTDNRYIGIGLTLIRYHLLEKNEIDSRLFSDLIDTEYYL